MQGASQQTVQCGIESSSFETIESIDWLVAVDHHDDVLALPSEAAACW